MKKGLKILIAIVVFIAILISSSVILLLMPVGKNYAQGWDGDTSKSGLYDAKGLYTSSEAEAITKEIRETAQAAKMNIAVYLSPVYRSDYSAEIFADDTYDETFGEDTDGVFYYMDVAGGSDACDWISTSGKAVLLYERRVDYIFSHLDSYLPSSYDIQLANGDFTQFKDGITQAISAFLSEISEGSDSSYMTSSYHDSSSGKYFFMRGGLLYITKSVPPSQKLPTLWFSECLGGLTALIVYLVGKSRYKFKHNTNPVVYVSRDETRFSESTDRYLRSHTSRTRIDSGGGGGGGRSGGGGHSHSGGHGGGGHHR